MAPSIEDPSRNDLIMANIVMGVFLGLGYFTTYHTILETRRAGRFATHVVLCWGEIFANLVLAVLSYLHVIGVLRPSFGLYFGIVCAWAIQVNCLLQIIVSRICVLVYPSTGRRLKLSVVILWTVICISASCIWIPAKLQTSPGFERLDFYWKYVDKCAYLLTDAALNYSFIYIVKTRLVQHGLTKYDRLVRFNQSMVIISLSTDCIIIGLMSLPNHFIYTLFCTVAFIIKLNIEIAMFRLIAKVAQSTGLTDDNNLHITSIAIGRADHRQSPSLNGVVSHGEGHDTLHVGDDNDSQA